VSDEERAQLNALVMELRQAVGEYNKQLAMFNSERRSTIGREIMLRFAEERKLVRRVAWEKRRLKRVDEPSSPASAPPSLPEEPPSHATPEPHPKRRARRR